MKITSMNQSIGNQLLCLNLLSKQNKLKILIKCTTNGRQFQGLHSYQDQNQIFKYAFDDMNSVFSYVIKSLKDSDQLIKVSEKDQKGILSIGTVGFNGNIKYFHFQNKEIEVEQSKRMEDVTGFIKKDIDILKDDVAQLKKQIKQMSLYLKKQNNNNKINLQDMKKDQSMLNLIQIKEAFEKKIALSSQEAVLMIGEIKQRLQKKIDKQIALRDQFLVERKEQIEALRKEIYDVQNKNDVTAIKQSDIMNILEASLSEQSVKVAAFSDMITPVYMNLIQQPKIFSGQINNWKNIQGTNGITTEADYSQLNLKNPPIVFTSLKGDNNHWGITGICSIHNVTNKKFQVKIRCTAGQNITPDWAKINKMVLCYQLLIKE